MDAADQRELMTAIAESTAPRHDASAVELLRTILDDDKAITRQELASLWGITDRCISFMLHSRVHISIQRWGELFAAIGDERILRLLIDPEKFALYPLPDPALVGTSRGIAHAFIRLKESHAQTSLYIKRMIDILGDMRVDGDDCELVCDLKHDLPELIASILAAERHIFHLYEKWLAQQESGVAGSIGKAVAR